MFGELTGFKVREVPKKPTAMSESIPREKFYLEVHNRPNNSWLVFRMIYVKDTTKGPRLVDLDWVYSNPSQIGRMNGTKRLFFWTDPW